jgi:hypothetical protein
MANRNWVINGYDGAKLIYEKTVTEGALTEAQASDLLLRLQSRHLSPDEIVSASLKRGAKGRSDHLEVVHNKGGTFALMTTGTSWHYTARLVPKDAA